LTPLPHYGLYIGQADTKAKDTTISSDLPSICALLFFSVVPSNKAIDGLYKDICH
jgi:hypothetical protein